MKKLTLNFDHVSSMVSSLCRDMALDQWRPEYVVGITRGGLVPATMISHYYNVPMKTLNVSLRDSFSVPESNLNLAKKAYGYLDTPANILIVDDINDSGATFDWIRQDWEKACNINPNRWEYVWGKTTRFACLINNAGSKFNDVNYYSQEINKTEEDVWIEFPWETWWSR